MQKVKDNTGEVRSFGCNLSYSGSTGEAEPLSDNEARAVINAIKLEDVEPERVQRMKTYADELRRKFPHLKPSRIARKVSEKYNVKLI